jgi:hypothetical protein
VRGFFDPLFYCNPWSPYLDGADNNLIYRNHTSSLVDDGTKADVDAWCSSADEMESSSGDVSWWIDVNLDGYGDTYGVVKVEQDASDYDLRASLVDPNGDEADYDYIYDYELDDGDVEVELDMNGYDAVADAGEWELLVEYADYDAVFHQETVVFDDYDPESEAYEMVSEDATLYMVFDQSHGDTHDLDTQYDHIDLRMPTLNAYVDHTQKVLGEDALPNHEIYQDYL